MQKILTAIDNPSFNNKLKEIEEFDVYENDLQYKEAIIDVLEQNNNFDILIIYEKLPGEINIKDLIKKIKNINNKINFIFILENKNEKLEKLLFDENIKNIFYNKEININNFILKIKNIKFNNEEKLIEKINNLEKIISNKNNEILNYKNNLINNKNSKIIVFYGNYKNNKKLIINNLLFIENKKILIIDFDNKFKNKTINKKENNNNLKDFIIKLNKNINLFNFNLFIKNKKNNINKIINKLFLEFSNKYDFILINLNNNKYEKYFLKNTEKIIFILELNNIEEIKKINKLINNLILNNLINKNKINILINKYNKKSINYKLIKNIFLNYNIIGKIKLNNFNIFLKNKNKKIIKNIFY